MALLRLRVPSQSCRFSNPDRNPRPVPAKEENA